MATAFEISQNQYNRVVDIIRWLNQAKPTSPANLYYKVYDDAGKDITYLWKGTFAEPAQAEAGRPPKSNEYVLSKDNLDRLKAVKEAQYKRAVQSYMQQQTAAEKLQYALDNPPFNKTGGLIYNVASVKQAYLNPGEVHTGKSAVADSRFNTFTSADGNTPARVNEALELWKNSANHKGMISTWTPPAGGISIDPQKVSGMGTIGVKDPNKYAFQFLYNPQPVTMAYRGAPAIDVSQYTSGSEEYALWAGGGAGGEITFDLLLMRMYDMPFYKNIGGKGVCTNLDIYRPGRAPAGEGNKGTLFNEQDAIYNRGTMYDIEFLLRTVLGIKINSQLRGETSDIGWIGAMPCELHLGPGLRYWGTLSALTVQHVIFNERMVPVFSTVQITFSRLPDYIWQPKEGANLGNGKLQGSNGNQRIRTNGTGGTTLKG